MDENNLYEELTIKNIEILNYNELIEKLNDTKKAMLIKIQVGIQNSQNNAEEGIFKDLEKTYIELDETCLALISYFKNPPSDEEKEIIYKTASIKKTMEDFAKFANEIEKISLDEKLKNYNTQIENFCQIVEYKLSNNAENYKKFLDDFIANGKQKLNIFSQIFTKMIKNTKYFFTFLAFASMGLGITLGILMFFVYTKYLEYEKLQKRANIITQGLATISVDENGKSLTLSFTKNKKTIFTENKNSIQITLQGSD